MIKRLDSASLKISKTIIMVLNLRILLGISPLHCGFKGTSHHVILQILPFSSLADILTYLETLPMY